MKTCLSLGTFRWCGWLAALAVAAPIAQAAAPSSRARVEKSSFGRTPDGVEIELYTLTNARGAIAKVITYGATLTELWVPDRSGKLGDVILGFDRLDGYLGEHPYFGSTVGRVANRIAKGRFTLDGRSYQLACNDGPNHLHGGPQGFHRKVWKAEPAARRGAASVRLVYTSPDGEEGYPGNLTATVTYTLTDRNELRIDYEATTDKATPINLTNHSYFNLAGEGDILAHQMMIAADRFTPVDDTLIPTGKLQPVQGTPMDFTRPMAIGSRIDQLTNNPRGYDHNYVLNSGGGRLARALRVSDPHSGRVMEVRTTEPGIQFYSGNFLDGTIRGKYGRVYPKHAAFCVEADHFPDSANQPAFPPTILRPGKTYRQTTIHRFSVQK
ncbi:MAG: galactose mutarotase [Verrucomicrobia bacterium]|nr:galactose mutarotase [Verrucomicrobiota bacterium]